jgi:hypothetical protein
MTWQITCCLVGLILVGEGNWFDWQMQVHVRQFSTLPQEVAMLFLLWSVDWSLLPKLLV